MQSFPNSNQTQNPNPNGGIGSLAQSLIAAGTRKESLTSPPLSPRRTLSPAGSVRSSLRSSVRSNGRATATSGVASPQYTPSASASTLLQQSLASGATSPTAYTPSASSSSFLSNSRFPAAQLQPQPQPATTTYNTLANFTSGFSSSSNASVLPAAAPGGTAYPKTYGSTRRPPASQQAAASSGSASTLPHASVVRTASAASPGTARSPMSLSEALSTLKVFPSPANSRTWELLACTSYPLIRARNFSQSIVLLLTFALGGTFCLSLLSFLLIVVFFLFIYYC